MTTAIASYEASSIKRVRSTKLEVETRRLWLLSMVERMKPMTVRQVFYQASVNGIVEKTEAGYGKIATDLTILRRSGRMPYGWLADSTRFYRKPRTYNSIEDALNETARLYRKALWADASDYVEIWLEKEALAGVVLPITSAYDVPLMVTKGYASLSFLYSAAEEIVDIGRPTFVYHLGDFDPSGVNAGEKIEETLREMAPKADIYFERIAVTEEQIDALKLPTRPTKTTDSRSKGFGDVSVELDAIEPDRLRAIVLDAIEQHLPADQFQVLKVAEKSERKLLGGLVGMLGDRKEAEEARQSDPKSPLNIGSFSAYKSSYTGKWCIDRLTENGSFQVAEVPTRAAALACIEAMIEVVDGGEK